MSNNLLWGTTYVGMSQDQVLKAVSDSHVVDNGEKICGGAIELVRVDKFLLAGVQFKGMFFFNDNGLQQVTFNTIDKKLYADNMVLFNNLITLLRARYGRELSMFINDNGADVTWLNERTNISLSLSEGNEPSCLALIYQTWVSREASKL